MTKHDRRAPKAAAETGHLVHDIGCGGKPIQITHPEAIRVLERGFLHATRNGMEPHVMRIAEDSARAFPGYDDQGERLPDGWTYFLGTGFDRIGRGAFLLRPVSVAGAEGWEAALRVAALAILREMREHLAGAPPSSETPRGAGA